MKSVGIIVEYNPFHNGHKYHLEKSKEMTNADIVVAVMSGDFLQRGEPAAFDRWKRAKMALNSGVDLLIELPSFFSTQNAEIFALSTVEILKILNIDSIVFGSESGDIEKLKKIAFLSESENFKKILKEELKLGNSYPTAYSNSLKKSNLNVEILSNDILGIEYIKAARETNIDMKALKRIGAGYHEKEIRDSISSATGIREILKNENGYESIKQLIPKENFNIIYEEKIVTLKEFYPFIRYEIINNFEKLIEIQDMEVGLDYRFFEAAKNNFEFNNFIEDVMTKRYTFGRIQRVLIHILLNITKKLTKDVKGKIPYIRVLGFNEKGRQYLNILKKNRKEQTPKIITSLKNIRKDLDENERKLLEFNEKCSLIYKMIRNYEDSSIPLIISKKPI